jgi:8-oxo-dGTP diphosphatase
VAGQLADPVPQQVPGKAPEHAPEQAPEQAPEHVPCAGGIVFDAAGRLLLIRRGRPPSQGLWSVPGGRCLTGESPAEACVREVAEETGLAVRVLGAVGRVERDSSFGTVYDITDYRCELLGGTLGAGDDADEARWVTGAELAALELAPGLLDALTEWALLPT